PRAVGARTGREPATIRMNSPTEIGRRTGRSIFGPRLGMLTRFSSPIASVLARFSGCAGRPPAEPGVEAHGQDAPQEREVHPCRGGAPVHVAGIPGNGDELQYREGEVAAGEWPDPEEIILAARVERGEADPDEPGADGARGERSQSPGPDLLHEVRRQEETQADREHSDST